jgi:hypothetical protein
VAALFCKTAASMRDLMALLSAIALTTAANNLQAQQSESQSGPTFTYQITSVARVSSNLKIEGIIRNTGQTPITYMFITCNGYNPNHEIIGTGSAIPVINFSLETNQTVYFQAEILNDTEQEIATYSINFDKVSTPDVTPTPFVGPTPFVVPPTPPPLQPPASITITTVPMPTDMQENIAAEKAAQAKQQRELFNKQEAEREANGDFSQAPGMTPEQKEAAHLKWAREEAAKSIKGATPAPQ